MRLSEETRRAHAARARRQHAAGEVAPHIEERAGIPVLVMEQGCRPATPYEVRFAERIKRLENAINRALDDLAWAGGGRFARRTLLAALEDKP